MAPVGRHTVLVTVLLATLVFLTTNASEVTQPRRQLQQKAVARRSPSPRLLSVSSPTPAAPSPSLAVSAASPSPGPSAAPSPAQAQAQAAGVWSAAPAAPAAAPLAATAAGAWSARSAPAPAPAAASVWSARSAAPAVAPLAAAAAGAWSARPAAAPPAAAAAATGAWSAWSPAAPAAPAPASAPLPTPAPTAAAAPPIGPSTSALWGNGSNPSSRLLDFSYAGYRQGQPIPANISVKTNVTAFGAVGNGVTDDTAAVLAAINATNCPPGTPCAVYFPPGRYVISRNISISKSVVLMGAGMNATTLYLPYSFQDLYGNTANSSKGDTSQWSFGPGMINFKAADTISYTATGTLRSFITTNATRGSYSVSVNNTSRLNVSQWIRITASDQPAGHPYAGRLIAYLYGNKLVSNWSDLVGDPHIVQFMAKVTAIEPNRSITFDRLLPYDLDTNWLNLSVHAWNPSTASQEQGVVDLTIEFPNSGPYPGHFRERGYNGLRFDNPTNCFAKNVQILNSDFSLGLMRGYFCTLQNIIVDVTYNRGKDNGHHGIEVDKGRDNLITDAYFKAPQVHDFTLSWYTTAAVLRRSRGTNINLDFHRAAPYGNLITDVDLGAATRPFASGGDTNRGPHAGSWQTFWNLRGASAISLPAATFGPDLNFVAINSTSNVTSPYNWYKEDIPNGALVPQDLYGAMLEKRLAAAPQPACMFGPC